MPRNALVTKTIAYHCNSINNLMQSLRRMIKYPFQYLLADLNLRFSIPCLWNSDFKEEELMKEYGIEQKNSSFRGRKPSGL